VCSYHSYKITEEDLIHVMTESDTPNAKRFKLNNSEPNRRLGSFWKSNQEIQALSIRLAQSQKSEPVPLPPQNVEEDVHSSIRKDSDEIVVVQDSVTNACAILPHPRHICGRYPFDTEPHKSYCDKCYCYVCQIPASECKMWNNNHCDADDSLLWQRAREQKKMIKESDTDVIELLGDSDDETDGDPLRHMDSNLLASTEILQELDQRLEDDPFQHHFDEEMKDDNEKDMVGQKPRKDARITEVFAHNLRVLDNEMNAKISALQRTKELEIDKMSGDIPQLNLHNSFFVEGVKIGWPYPVIMPPQRQMAFHLTKAFKNSRHCVIESPTGTGKSAAILCSALAWQRYHAKTSPSNEVVKIIYCSRTHSQTGQMVASLRKTPYRPRMAILGSRDRLCIHKKLRPRSKVLGEDSVKKTFDNINIGCQIRTQNVEAYRKSRLNRLPIEYNDDSPPTHHPGDDGEKQNALDDNENDDDEIGDRMESEKYQTCPHYRQLTNVNVARNTHSMFVPDKERVNCCSNGGEKSKFGTHDIEDLVRTGMNPNIRKGVSLYRDSSKDTFGITMNQSSSGEGPISIQAIRHKSVAEKEGSLSVGDVLIAVNGVDVSRGHTILSVSESIRTSKNPLLLDVYSRENQSTDLDVDEYSEDSACPYYISKVLSKSADLVFCPYNYILDPDIRSAMELNIENAIVILDEAHNVEDALRSLGSDKFGEIELLKILALLDFYAAKWEPQNQRIGWGHENSLDEDESLQDRIPEICHSLLLFLEPIILSMKEHKEKFESDQIQFGISKAIEEYERFKSPDDKEFEVRYFGPTGSGDGKKPIGCQRFFESFKTTKELIDLTHQNISDFMKYMNTKRGNPRADERRKLADRVCKLIIMLCSAFKSPE
jgi:Fanconi anemia group J protein